MPVAPRNQLTHLKHVHKVKTLAGANPTDKQFLLVLDDYGEIRLVVQQGELRHTGPTLPFIAEAVWPSILSNTKLELKAR